MNSDSSRFPPFAAPYAPDDGVSAARLLGTARLSAQHDARIDHTASRLIGAIRTQDDRLGGVGALSHRLRHFMGDRRARDSGNRSRSDHASVAVRISRNLSHR